MSSAVPDLGQWSPSEIREFLARFPADEVERAILSLPAAMQDALAAEIASSDFCEFVRQAWQYVPQTEELEWSWHLAAVCLHLEEVARGTIPRLVINIAPGTGKSVLLAVLWPAWIWTWWPKCQFLFASYSHDFVVRDASRCRDVITTDWYRRAYSEPAGWRIRRDQNAKDNFANTLGGVRASTSTDGAGAGLRANIIGIDDPLNIKEAMSAAARRDANDFIGKTLSQRFVDARQPRVAMIMQRLHEEDPTAFVLKGPGWQHLMLPSEFDPRRRSVTQHYEVVAQTGERRLVFFWRDPREQPGELLFPTRFPKEVLDAAKQPNSLGLDGYAGQHEQQPTNFAGGMFPRRDWRFYVRVGRGDHEGLLDLRRLRPDGCDATVPAVELPGKMDRTIITMDCAFKDNPAGSRVAIHVWGRRGADRFLLDRHTDFMDFPASKQALRVMAQRWPQALEKYVEDAANGPAIIAELRHEVSGLIPVRADGSKEARAAAGQPYHRAHNCYLPDGAPWLPDLVTGFAAFPKGRDKDDVDAFAHAMRKLEDQPEGETGFVPWGRR